MVLCPNMLFLMLEKFVYEVNINRCWAPGQDGWRPLAAIPQLRWTLVASNSPVFDESQLAIEILNCLIKICEQFPSRDDDGCVVRPIPKAKRILSAPNALPHIVQLLLTFDPVIVEKTASLLNLIIEDNPQISRLYLTGAFFFVLMYTGSNILPIAKFLHYTHLRQAFRSETVSFLFFLLFFFANLGKTFQ